MRHVHFELKVREDTNRALGFYEAETDFKPKIRAAIIFEKGAEP